MWYAPCHWLSVALVIVSAAASQGFAKSKLANVLRVATYSYWCHCTSFATVKLLIRQFFWSSSGSNGCNIHTYTAFD